MTSLAGKAHEERLALAPILDAQANLTFTLEEDESRIFRVSKLKLTAGSITGIRLKHPIFYFISAKGAGPDPADSLAATEVQVEAGKSATVGPGTVLLTQAPVNKLARIGVAFQLLERWNMGPTMEEKCKAFNLFNPAVKDQLVSCAQSCHSPGKNNVANGAFNMSDAGSSDVKALQQLCLSTLGRIDRALRLAKGPRRVGMLELKASIQHGLGQTRPAIATLEEALRLAQPASPAAEALRTKAAELERAEHELDSSGATEHRDQRRPLSAAEHRLDGGSRHHDRGERE